MNDLSWLLYLADVLPAFSGGVGVVGALISIAALIGLAVNIIMSIYGEGDASDAEEVKAMSQKLAFFRWLFPCALLLSLSTNLVPSKETFYAIAVSEMGEELLKSPEIGKARKALNNWLDDQLEEQKVVAVSE